MAKFGSGSRCRCILIQIRISIFIFEFGSGFIKICVDLNAGNILTDYSRYFGYLNPHKLKLKKLKFNFKFNNLTNYTNKIQL